MRKTLKAKFLTEEYVIDYGNDYICNYTLKDGVLIKYYFSKKDGIDRISYIKDISLYQLNDINWDAFTHSRSVADISVEELENFTDFDNLYEYNNSLLFRNNIPITRNFKVDYIFSQIYLDIETTEKECQVYLNKLPDKYFKNKVITLIPWYNRDSDKSFHCSVEFEVHNIPQHIFTEGVVKDHICHESKVNIINRLMSLLNSL